MNVLHIAARRTLALAVPALVLVAACSKRTPLTALPNQRPSVHISADPASSGSTAFYAYEISWAGFDRDGRVDHFQYAIDPPSSVGSDTAWVRTSLNRQVFLFAAERPDSVDTSISRGFHTFVVRAVDDRNLESAPDVVSFTATTVSPYVFVVNPHPSRLLLATVGTRTTVSWDGVDPDGQGSRRPVYYKHKLFTVGSEFDLVTAASQPDSLRKYYAPQFAGWDSSGADTTSAVLDGLVPGHTYMFVVVGFDEAGAYSPAFSLDSNMLYFTSDFAASLGPRLSIHSDFFSYSFASGGFNPAPENVVPVEAPADLPMSLRWSAQTQPGGFVSGFRWALDLKSFDDETPRTDENTDVTHWSQWGPGTIGTTLTLSPPAGQQSAVRLLFLECRDNNGQTSLGVLQITAVRPTFERELLFVNDTRFSPDRLNLATACSVQPRFAWPTAAELDTFLYAVGDKPWRCYPAGTRSTPGLFAGYSMDTIGTPTRGVAPFTLSMLAHYRHIVWFTDSHSAFNNDGPPGGYPEMSVLRWFAQPNHTNLLNIWRAQGGKLWLMGGGIAAATQLDYEVGVTLHERFSHANNELVPGRFMYDVAHWRSEITDQYAQAAVRSVRAVGGWPGAPDYSLLPGLLRPKSAATDAMPPWRTVAPEFYQSQYAGEMLTLPNSVLEDLSNDPGTPQFAPMLDTLYNAVGSDAGIGKPVMTYYHGSEGPPVVFSGFPLWYFQRQQAIDLADFVLQRIWGLTRRPVVR